MPTTLDRLADTIEPLTGESHTDFAIRFHDDMADAIPRTSERQAAMTSAWDSGNPDGDDLDRYAASECGPEKYELVRNVSYFDEHKKTHASGKTSEYGRDELASIVEKCNARIADSGNLPALTDGHTPDDMDQAKMPAVLGYAGPFRLGMVGNKNPRWAIFANEHWLTRYAHLKDERRTRSVEIECAPPIKDRYFHSIAALGALAPQRDTGMVRYSLSDASDRAEVEKYSSYGSAFTGMPGNQPASRVQKQPTSRREDYADDSATQPGGNMNQPPSPAASQDQGTPLSENDALQVASEVVNALMQQPWVQWAMRQAQSEQGGGDGIDAGQQGEGSPAPPAAGQPAAGQNQPPVAGQGQPPAPAAPDPTASMDPDEKEIHGALPPHLQPKFASKIGKGCAPAGGPSASRQPPTPPNHQPPRPAGSQPQAYSSDMETEPDELDVDDDDNDQSNDPVNGDETVTQQIAPEKYALLERQNRDQAERIAKLEKASRNVDRYTRLIDLKESGDFVYDAKAELADCDDMADAQFEKHITKTIPEKYQRGGGNMPELFVEEFIEQRQRSSGGDVTVRDQIASINDRDEVVKYATRHGLDYETAREKYQAEKADRNKTTTKVA